MQRPIVVAHLFGCVAGGMETWLLSLIRELPMFEWRVWVEQDARTTESALARFRQHCAVYMSSEWEPAICDAHVLISPGHDIMLAFKGKRILVAHGAGAFTTTLMERCGSSADWIVAVSASAAQAVPEMYRQDIQIIRHGVRASCRSRKVRAAKRQAWGCDEGDLLMGFIGRVAPDKCPEYTVRASVLVDGVAVLIGSEWDEQTKLRVQRSARRCIFAGESDDMSAAYSALDCVVMCSRSEGFGYVLAECLAEGVPLVSTPVGIVAELTAKYGPLCQLVDFDPPDNELEQAVRAALLNEQLRRRAQDIVAQELPLAPMIASWRRLIESAV